ncbi:uncharacterized protein LOC111633746 [Centruroides sculpturatus]|uniref:uncharacterized protein LOC111633746 n=1 Tax=Centruroides sculpturatus TaxID=218467 RepID=UPI000C6E3F6A|nr:uncharacterized protein LOC111633746 [Centruroides sculpturatus]
MQDIEKLLRTVYTMFSRSPVKKQKLEELAHISEHDVVSFKPLNEVRWLSRQFAVNALMRNYDVLIEYCEEQVNKFNDPICNYCITILTNPQYRVALTVFNDVLDDLASLYKFLQKSCLTTIEAFDYVKAKINQLKSLYLDNKIYWSEKVKKVGYDVDTASIIRFVKRVCNHLNNRFPDDELREWQAFNLNAILNALNFEFGNENIKRLIREYSIILNVNNNESTASKILEQYCNFKFIISQKLENCSIKTFTDMLNYVRNDDEFKELAVIIDIIGTFQASSVDCERGFSVMNSIKCKIRNRLESEHLCDLMRI